MPLYSYAGKRIGTFDVVVNNSHIVCADSQQTLIPANLHNPEVHRNSLQAEAPAKYAHIL